MKTLRIKKLHSDAVIPVRARSGDAGLDLTSIISETLLPGEGKLFKTGIAIALEAGFVGLIWDRSSMGKRGIKTLGGVVDSGYRGEVGVMLWNLSKETQSIKAGERIAQLLIQAVLIPETEEVLMLDETERGIDGFGSTGK